MKLFTILTVSILLLGVTTVGATTYYVDAQFGSDDNDGHTPEQAWRSLDKVSEITFAGGDQLLLTSA